MQQRYCTCGVPIPTNRIFCVDCHLMYGKDRTKWPDWLIDWVRNYQKELDYENQASNREMSYPESMEA